MDNKAIAGILYETADLLEIDRQDSFRIRSYRNAAQAIEAYRRIAGRFLLDAAEREAQKIVDHLKDFPGVEKVTPAGSLRRGRETVGDLDILVTGKACCDDAERDKLVEHIIKLPGLMEIIARGENKVSFRLRGGMQVDVRLLPPESFGAAMQYFTGSKAHNVALRQRALKMGYTLSEYSLATLEGEKPVAGKTEEEIYGKLNLDYIPPEMRENLGEIDLADKHALPTLITLEDLQGDIHMHTVATDGRNTIEEKAETARAHRHKYMAITDHSKNLAFANGLDDKRAVEHITRIRKAAEKIDGIKIFAGVEVDILADG